MKDKKIKVTQAIYQKFLNHTGSESISSKHALKALYKIISKKKPKKILEVGAGIGTITAAILSSAKHHFPDQGLTFYCWEDNAFCLNALRENLQEDFHKLKVISDLKDLEPDIQFDFIVVDGGTTDPGFYERLEKTGIFFIEGKRTKQRNLILSLHKTRNFSVCRGGSFFDHLVGIKSSYSVIYFEPSFSLKITNQIRNLLHNIKNSTKLIRFIRFIFFIKPGK